MSVPGPPLEQCVHAPEFAEIRAFLQSGAAWPGQSPPRCIETHASLVFLTEGKAWKLKKPVNLVHVDQRTLASRRHLCQAELRVNRELAGNVYRGLTPLVLRPGGSLALGGEGQVVDWLIEAARLPASEMLDRRLVGRPAPRTAEVDALCGVLVDFYRRQQRSCEMGDVFYRRLVRDHRIAARHLRQMCPKAGVVLTTEVLDVAGRAIRSCREEILCRGQRGLVMEGHGDLRAEHVCLTDPPVIFDRLEMDPGLRIVDPFHEINALGLECASKGAGWIRAALLVCLSKAVAPPSRNLLTVYGVAASLTRARIAADHFRDCEVRTPEKWRSGTRNHLAAAAQLLARWRQD